MSKSLTHLEGVDPDLPISDHWLKMLGAGVVFLVFGVFGAWAVLAPLDSAASATGVITVQTYRKTVQHLEGGIVKDLLVRDGDEVKVGDPLIILSDTQLRAEFEMVKSQLIASLAVEARLLAERDGKPSVDFSRMLEQNTPRAIEAKDSENQVFKARRLSHLGEISVLEKRVSQLREQIRGLETMIRTKGGLDKSYSGEIRELKELLAEGFVDKQRMLDQERKRDMLQTEVADHRTEIIKTGLQINETELQILQLKKDFNSEVVTQLAEVQTKNFDLKERMDALQDRIQRVVIRAPDSGMVLGMSVHTIGGVVSPATPLLDIVPSFSDLVIEAKVSPNDIDRVTIGRPANIRLTNYNAAITPVIDGVVSRISADRLLDETNNNNPYFLARISLTEDSIRRVAALKLVPGMPTEVLINTGERTLFQYLMQPAANAFAKSLIEK
ncbi:epimerase transport system membrane fusion protein [Azomonas agilis]|uniref:Membrane fusion protein (MFP) family protein n=1 Tax=Azomonas agilis TaxID=116849 RepID=A0A562IYS7_9GAMM|nr:HlyD family type I secretion periplasmic adaptor subunit [Azomonas agilis]TWH76046.1 epimerase transport system membrane fusion protein [Azomonas agilis]